MERCLSRFSTGVALILFACHGAQGSPERPATDAGDPDDGARHDSGTDGAAHAQDAALEADGAPPDVADGGHVKDASEGSDSGEANTLFVPAALPTLPAPSSANDQPVYVFLFTHTEDPFNHTLSEARYSTIAPMIENVDAAYPNAHPVWTIEFMGSDANTVWDRNGNTGVVSTLKSLESQGLVRFGYHSQHDPTYTNRPIDDEITAASTWEEKIAAVDEWISCEKYLTATRMGGCIPGSRGGVLAVTDNFGEVHLISGLALGDGGAGPFEDDTGVHTFRRYAPDVQLAFGFSDHAPMIANYDANVEELMTILSPSGETSGAIFWANDLIRINDGNRMTDQNIGQLEEGEAAVRTALSRVDRTRPQIMNAGIGGKWIYARTSPTTYGYTHPSSPTLPSSSLQSSAEIAANYANTEAALEYLAGSYFPATTGSRFVGPDEVKRMVAPDDYVEVTSDELDVIARWLILSWTDRPPSYASDGEYFYSLRDAFGLLARALAEPSVSSQGLTKFYGPEVSAASSSGFTLEASEVSAIAETMWTIVGAADSSWQERPSNIMPSEVDTSEGRMNAASLLYAMAWVYASRYAGTPTAMVEIPASQSMPRTFDLYEDLGCVSCEDTAWSTKPARVTTP